MSIAEFPVISEEQALIAEYENRIISLEAENKALRNREYTILRALPEIVFIIDLNERFVFLNNTCREKFQLSSNKLDYSTRLKDVIVPESILHVHKIYLKYGDQDSFHAKELKGIKKNGETFPLTVYFSKLFENGALTGFVGIGFDITERVDIETKLKEANLAKMKFLSIIAHDLRNPFNSLVGFSTLLLSNYQRYSDEKIQEYIKHMATAANQGYQLLENLLEWAKANMRKVDINPVFFNLGHIIIETTKLLEGNASKKEITLVHEFEMKVIVYADQNMIRTVIRNLLSNAIKFTHRKGKIIIRASQDQENAFIEVIDNGVGINPENMPNLFSLSNETSTLGTERERGTGLGLIMCYEFVTINKGTISAESISGQGSTFKVKLPISKP